jgi:deoxyadenosine/deoxycytidine kinase
MEPVLGELLRLGILGPVVASCVWFIVRLHKDLREVEKARAEDAKQVIDKLIGINDKWQQAFTANAEVLKLNNSALEQVKDALNDVEEVLQDVSRQVKPLVPATRK